MWLSLWNCSSWKKWRILVKKSKDNPDVTTFGYIDYKLTEDKKTSTANARPPPRQVLLPPSIPSRSQPRMSSWKLVPLHLQSPRELSCFRLCRRRVTYHLRERQRISILPWKTSVSNSLCLSQIMALLDRDCRFSTTCVSMVLDHLHESCSQLQPVPLQVNGCSAELDS